MIDPSHGMSINGYPFEVYRTLDQADTIEKQFDIVYAYEQPMIKKHHVLNDAQIAHLLLMWFKDKCDNHTVYKRLKRHVRDNYRIIINSSS